MAGDWLNDAAATLFAVDRQARAFGLGLLAVGVVLIVLAARRWRLDRRRMAARRARIAARRVDFAAGRSSGWVPPLEDPTAVMYRVPEVWPTDPGRTAVIPRQRGGGR